MSDAMMPIPVDALHHDTMLFELSKPVTMSGERPGYMLYCIVLYLQPVLNSKSYDGARVLEASGRPLLVKGRT